MRFTKAAKYAVVGFAGHKRLHLHFSILQFARSYSETLAGGFLDISPAFNENVHKPYFSIYLYIGLFPLEVG